MFGTLRLLLAVMVVYCHLGMGGIIGSRAVFGFYLLSGYLMTLVLNEQYYFKVVPYFANRAMRLFPDYWIIAGLTLCIIIIIPEAQQFHSAYAIRTKPIDILGNLFIFPFVFYKTGLRLVPPTWSVALEIVNYFLLWLIVARRMLYALLALGIGIGFHAWSLAVGQPYYERYNSILASLLPFALGAVLYFYRPIFYRLSNGRLIAIGLSGAGIFGVSVIVLYYPKIGILAYNAAIYVNLLGVFAVIAALAKFKSSRYDVFFGDLAYPVFLIHWLCGFLIGHFFHLSRGPLMFWISLPLIFVAAYFITTATRRTIEPIRSRLRELARNAPH